MSEQPAAGWYADPTGRFDHRYWDGDSWTEHVSRNGEATTDPVESATETWRVQAGTSRRTNAKAIASLVLSIVWLGGLASVVAVVLGVMARREIRDRPDEAGGGMATAGIVLGVIGVLGALAVLAVILSFVAYGPETVHSEFG